MTLRHRTYVVFQSTHPHGVRPPFGGTKVETCYSFNPRTHTGCDQFDVCVLHILKRFQSTHPHGVRLRLIPIRSANRLFQSTHPHGVRLWGQGFYSISQSFNPRTHTGCDCAFRDEGARFCVSIHAPTRGATVQLEIGDNIDYVSIHAPTRGATIVRNDSYGQTLPVSIHAPTRGATFPYIQRFINHLVSIHAPTRGATAS